MESAQDPISGQKELHLAFFFSAEKEYAMAVQIEQHVVSTVFAWTAALFAVLVTVICLCLILAARSMASASVAPVRDLAEHVEHT